MRVDELDAELIRLLQSDGRLSNRELARQLGIPASTCLERVRSLTRQGVIRGYHAEIDPVALNRGVQAMVSVQVRPLSRAVIDTFKASASRTETSASETPRDARANGSASSGADS